MLLWLACAPPDPVVRDVSSVRVQMPDGAGLAVDVLLPASKADPLPTVLLQTRYWRSFALRVPDQPGQPPVGTDTEAVTRLLGAGYAVVVADVRGTGASEGAWAYPWSEGEVADSGHLVDWIVAQPWSDGRVGTYGVSYAGTAALLTAATGRPAVRAVLAREIEWDVVEELAAPGGVRNRAFLAAWSASVAALDRGQVADFFPLSARLVVTGPRPLDDDPDGAALGARIAARRVANVAADLGDVRAPTDAYGTHGFAAGHLGPARFAEALAGSDAAIGVWGGWWDGATAVAVTKAWGRLPGLVDARIGAWDHEGTGSASPFPEAAAAVDLADVVGFFDRHLRGERVAAERTFSWYEAGAGWRRGSSPPETSVRRWYPSREGRLEQRPPTAGVHTFSAPLDHTMGPDTRWTAGLLRPVAASPHAVDGGLPVWISAPLDAPLRIFGAPTWTCALTPEPGPAAVHVYLEALAPDGRVTRLTEGVARVDAHVGAVPLLPLGAEVSAGHALALFVAGADLDTFEVVAATPTRLTARWDDATPCSLDVPVVAAPAGSGG